MFHVKHLNQHLHPFDVSRETSHIFLLQTRAYTYRMHKNRMFHVKHREKPVACFAQAVSFGAIILCLYKADPMQKL